MTISDEDFHKMFDLVRQLHEHYTKALERENETLRKMLEETQKQLDEALATIAKNGKTDISEQYEKIRKEWEKVRDNPPYVSPGIGTGNGPWTVPPNTPIWTTYTTSTTNPIMVGGAASSANNMGANSHGSVSSSVDSNYEKFVKQFITAKMYAKADEDG